jgi:hypothetical protein
MNKMTAVLMGAALLAPLSNAHSQDSQRPFNFNAPSVSGFANAEVFITGGGTFDPVAGVVKAGGAFHVLRDITVGPLAGVKAGETVRWDSEEALRSFDIRCNGAETPRTVVTDDNTVVMNADVYRAGDGNQASLHVVMFASADDEDGGLTGNQTVWIQGVGCGDALVNFHN